VIYRFPCGARLPREKDIVGVPLLQAGASLCVWSNHMPKGQNATVPANPDGSNAPCLFGCDQPSKKRKVKVVMPEGGGEGRRFVVLCRPAVEIVCGHCHVTATADEAKRTWWHHPDDDKWYCPTCWVTADSPDLPPLRMRRIAAAHDRERGAA